MKHIILNVDELEKLPQYATFQSYDGSLTIHAEEEYVKMADLRALIANSPQVDGMANSRELFEQFATLHEMSVLKVGDAYSNDDTNYAWWVWQKALSISSDTNYADLIKQAVNRFLGWKLPSDFNPDAGISFKPDVMQIKNELHWPIGTNIFTADQAKSMFEYCLSAYKPQADDVRKDAERYRWIRANPRLDICGTDEMAEFDAMIDQAIDKARE